MNKIQKLHEQYNRYPEYSKFHLSFQFDKKIKDWKFLGYRCVHCNKIFVKPGTIPQHVTTCRAIPNSNKHVSKTILPLEKQQIVTQYGTEWKPLDFNQK